MSNLPTRLRQIVRLRLFALLCAALLVAGCNQFIDRQEYQPTPIPADVTQLFRVSGNTRSDTVWIVEALQRPL